jgi:hypothetical protein
VKYNGEKRCLIIIKNESEASENELKEEGKEHCKVLEQTFNEN